MLEIDVDEAEIAKGVFEAYNYEQLAEILDNPELNLICYNMELGRN